MRSSRASRVISGGPLRCPVGTSDMGKSPQFRSTSMNGVIGSDFSLTGCVFQEHADCGGGRCDYRIEGQPDECTAAVTVECRAVGDSAGDIECATIGIHFVTPVDRSASARAALRLT